LLRFAKALANIDQRCVPGGRKKIELHPHTDCKQQ